MEEVLCVSYCFLPCGVLSSAALIIALVKISVLSSIDVDSETKSVVINLHELILNDSQSAFDNMNFCVLSVSSSG